MKLAIPTENKTLETKVHPSFGRAPYFLIYDVDTKESKFIENTAATSTGGAGIKAAQIIVDSNVDTLLTAQLGGNAAAVLKPADVKIYKSVTGSLQDNIDAFVDGKLSLLDNVHAGYHGRRMR